MKFYGYGRVPDATEEDVKEFIKDGLIDAFLDGAIEDYPNAVAWFLEQHADDFREFLGTGGAEGRRV